MQHRTNGEFEVPRRNLKPTQPLSMAILFKYLEQGWPRIRHILTNVNMEWYVINLTRTFERNVLFLPTMSFESRAEIKSESLNYIKNVQFCRGITFHKSQHAPSVQRPHTAVYNFPLTCPLDE